VYLKIIVALNETNILMKEIDKEKEVRYVFY